MEVRAPERAKLNAIEESFMEEIARELLNHPPVKRTAYGYSADPAQRQDTPRRNPSEQERKAVRQVLTEPSLPSQMLRAAFKQRGAPGARAASEFMVRFFKDSGMIHRLRCRELERVRKGSAVIDYSRIPAIWPTRIVFWEPPQINYSARLEGANSVDGLDRDRLIDVAVDFYRSELRYPPFEKCILEALLNAEVCATFALARQGEYDKTLTDRLLKHWTFFKTYGAEPRYSLTLGAGAALKSLVSLAVSGALLLWAFLSYRHTPDPSWLATGSLAILIVLVSMSVLRRGLTTVLGAALAAPVGSNQWLDRSTPIARAIHHLEALTKILCAPVCSVTLAREAALRCYAAGGIFDQVPMPYLDRAQRACEHLWSNHLRDYEFESAEDD